jgi:hypothetical protein
LRRCDAADVSALTRIGNALFAPRHADEPSTDSFVLQALIMRAELWDDRAATTETLRIAEQPQLFRLPFESLEAYDVLPRYPRPAAADFFPTTNVPILVLNGTMDPQTPPWSSDPAGAHYSGAHQHYVLFDRVTHGTLFSSRIDGAQETCAASIMRQFVTDPEGELDTSCRTQAPSYEWQSSWLASAFLGTSDLYENGLSIPTNRPEDRPRIDALHRRARELVRNVRPF